MALLVGTQRSELVRASSPAADAMPVAKAALFSKQHAALVKARQHPFPKTNPADYTSPPPIPQNPPHPGIVPTRQSPLPAMQFLANNMWTIPLPGGLTWAVVYTGQQQIPTTQGAVYVLHEVFRNGQYTFTYPGLFLAPTGTATLYPVGWSGTTLRLNTSSGQSLSFNAATDTFSGT